MGSQRKKKGRSGTAGEIKVVDSRGALRSLTNWMAADASVDPIRREVAKKVLLINYFSGNPLLLAAIYVAEILLLVIITLLFQLPAGGWLTWMGGALLGVVVTIVSCILIARGTQTRSVRLRRVADRFGVCPCCGYDLHGLPEADDGCRQCPECGSAWVAPNTDHRGPLRAELARGPVSEYANTWRASTSTVLGSLLNPRVVGKIKDDRGRMVEILGPGFKGEIDILTGERNTEVIARVQRATRGLGLTIGRRARPARNRLLSIGLCPSCADAVGKRVPDNDGCITCPTCGAAWRAERIDQPGDSEE